MAGKGAKMEDVTRYLESIAAQGRNGDTMLAHINPAEAALLKAAGGSGTINPSTGLPEFFFEELVGGIGDLFGGAGDFLGDIFGSGGGGDIFDVGSNLAGLADSGGGSWSLPDFGAGGGAFDFGSGLFDLGGGGFGGDGGFDFNALLNGSETAANGLPAAIGDSAQPWGAWDAGGVGGDFGVGGDLGGATGADPNLGWDASTWSSGGAGTGSTSLSGNSYLDKALGWTGRNASWLLPAAALGYSALNKSSGVPNEGAIKGNAKYLSQSGKDLTGPLLNNDPLPSGAKNAIDLASQANNAAVKSAFANMGLTGSTMEAQALQSVNERAAAQRFQDALALATQGFNNIGASNQAYTALANATMASDAAFTNALAQLTGAIGRGAGLSYYGNTPGVPRTF